MNFYLLSENNGPALSLADKFSKYSLTRKHEFLGLVLDDFLTEEVRPLHDAYQTHFLELAKLGIRSKIDSQKEVLETQYKQLNQYLIKMENALNPSKLRAVLNSKKIKDIELKWLADKIAICRTRMDICESNLMASIRNASETLQAKKLLVENLISKRKDLSSLGSELVKNSTGPESSHEPFGEIINSHLNLLTIMTNNAVKLLDVQSAIVSTALAQLKTGKQIHLKVEDFITDGAPLLMLDSVPGQESIVLKMSEPQIKELPSEPKGPSSQKTQLGARIFTILHANITPKSKLTTIYKLLSANSKSITAFEAEYILSTMPRNISWGIENNSSLKLANEIFEKSNKSFEKWYNMEVLIAYEVALKIQKEDETSKRVYQIIEDIFRKDSLMSSNPEYSSALAQVLAEIKTKIW